MFADSSLVLIRGAGDLATGVAWRLSRCGLPVVMTEIARPTPVRRAVAFAEAVYDGTATVEGVTATLVGSVAEVWPAIHAGMIPIVVDPHAAIVPELEPAVLVDAILAKRNLGTSMADAPLVIGLGPGFTAGSDVHVVIETMRGHRLGRVISDGAAEPNTGIPGVIAGHGADRVLRAPADGALIASRAIGDSVSENEIIARVAGQPVVAPFDGVLRGLVREGLIVHTGMKIGDVDPRQVRESCFTISDKALAIAGGVTEAIFARMAAGWPREQALTDASPKGGVS